MLTYSGCLVTRDAAQTIPNATVTLAIFDAEIHDTGDFHENVALPGQIKIPIGGAGTYYLYASIQWEADAVGQRYISLRVNGTIVSQSASATIGGQSYTQNVNTTFRLEDEDIVTLIVYQSSGGNLDIEQTDYTPRFGVDLMGA